MAAATRHFSRKRDENVNESTIRTILKAYKREVSLNGGEAMNHLPEKKRGRSVLLGADVDTRVQAYLKRVREGGGVVSARIAIAAARGLLLCYDKSRLAEFGGPVVLKLRLGIFSSKENEIRKAKGYNFEVKVHKHRFRSGEEIFLG